jgi:hypothetical protein
MLNFIEQYTKHAALNFGQACQGVRYIYSHPDIDRVALKGSFKHFMLSLKLRAKRVLNDIFFTVTPPQWHHTRKQLEQMKPISHARWFQYGYCAWRFNNDGTVKINLPSDVDKRWDPRCKK